MTRPTVSSVAIGPPDDAVVAAPRASSEQLRLILVFGGVLLALLLPLLLSVHPRMVDAPNHLARHYIGSAIAGSEALQAYYQFSWRLIPNLAADAVHVPLSWFLSIYDAGRVVLGITIALWLAAPMVLYRVLWGRFSLWPLFAGLVIYNANLVWGFENYLLASAFSVLLFALWIAWRQHLKAVRLLLFVALATGLYLAHIVAFGLLGLLILTFETGDLWRARKTAVGLPIQRLACAVLPFVPGTVHFFALLAAGSAAHGSGTAFGPLAERMAVFFSPTEQGLEATDRVTLAAVIGVFVFGAFQRRWFRLHRGMVPVICVLVALAAIVPLKLMGVYMVHLRLPFVVLALLVAASHWKVPSLGLRRGFAVLFALVLAARALDLTLSWRQHDAEMSELIAAYQNLGPESRLLTVAGSNANPGPLHWHSSAFAVIERSAFTPTLFTGAHLLQTTMAYRRLDHPQTSPIHLDRLAAARTAKAGPVKRQYWTTWWRDFSHILLLDRRPGANPFPHILEPVARGAAFTLYRNRAFDASAPGSARPAKANQ